MYSDVLNNDDNGDDDINNNNNNNNDNNTISWTENQHIRMISEWSRDNDDWSNDPEHFVFELYLYFICLKEESHKHLGCLEGE